MAIVQAWRAGEIYSWSVFLAVEIDPEERIQAVSRLMDRGFVTGNRLGGDGRFVSAIVEDVTVEGIVEADSR